MTRQWVIGDVAMLTDRFDTTERIGIFYASGEDVGGQAPLGKWFLPETNERVWSSVKSARPLVILDPEHEPDVDRAANAVRDHHHTDVAVGIDWLNMQAALRSLTADPKPAEPQNDGAVVEDADGIRWVRTSPIVTSHRNDWIRSGCTFTGSDARHWDGITAVKVLSEGVTQ